jgi:hypothetical protein
MLDDDIDTKKFTPKAMSNLIAGWKDKGQKPEEVDNSSNDYFANGRAISIYKTYQLRLKTLNSADFGDLLLYNLNILNIIGLKFKISGKINGKRKKNKLKFILGNIEFSKFNLILNFKSLSKLTVFGSFGFKL